MDVKSVFLNGVLTKEVYVVQPPYFVHEGTERKVLKLKKALYGLCQAPIAWNFKLDNSLIKLGFHGGPRTCMDVATAHPISSPACTSMT